MTDFFHFGTNNDNNEFSPQNRRVHFTSPLSTIRNIPRDSASNEEDDEGFEFNFVENIENNNNDDGGFGNMIEFDEQNDTESHSDSSKETNISNKRQYQEIEQNLQGEDEEIERQDKDEGTDIVFNSKILRSSELTDVLIEAEHKVEQFECSGIDKKVDDFSQKIFDFNTNLTCKLMDMEKFESSLYQLNNEEESVIDKLYQILERKQKTLEYERKVKEEMEKLKKTEEEIDRIYKLLD